MQACATFRKSMKMNVQLERTTQSLDKINRPGAGRPARVSGLFHQMRGNRPVQNARHLAVTAFHDNNRLYYRDIPDLSGPVAGSLTSLNTVHLILHWKYNSYSIVIYKIIHPACTFVQFTLPASTATLNNNTAAVTCYPHRHTTNIEPGLMPAYPGARRKVVI